MSDCDICESSDPSVVLCLACCAAGEQRAADKARSEERAAVVAWLRLPGWPYSEQFLLRAAQRIEAGEHRTKSEEA